jgi:hypothetical protein
VQFTWQCAPLLQETLPLAPTVRSHVDSAAHDALHDAPQVPLHSLPSAQDKEQLSPEHPVPSIVHDIPAAQEQLDPEQVAGSVPPPQPATKSTVPSTAIHLVIAPPPGARPPSHAPYPRGPRDVDIGVPVR